MKLAFSAAFPLPVRVYLIGLCLATLCHTKARAEPGSASTSNPHRLLRGNIEKNESSMSPGALSGSARLLRSNTEIPDTNQNVTILPRPQSLPYTAGLTRSEPIDMEKSEAELLDAELATQNFKLAPLIPRQQKITTYAAGTATNRTIQSMPGDFYGHGRRRIHRSGQIHSGWMEDPYYYRLRFPGCCNNNLSLSGKMMLHSTSILNTPSVIPPPLALPPLPVNLNPSNNFRLPPKQATMIAENTIWTPWYEKFGQALYRSWKLPANIQGTAELRLTVMRNGSIKPELLSTDNYTDIFRQSLLKAAKSLEKSEFTRFPAGSQRSGVTFQARLQSALAGKEGSISLITGDIERHWRIIPLQ